jgi:hypothetical protein
MDLCCHANGCPLVLLVSHDMGTNTFVVFVFADGFSPYGTDVPIVLPLAAAGPKRSPSRWYEDMACMCCSEWHDDHDHNISPGQRASQAGQAQSVSGLAVCKQKVCGVLELLQV